MVLGGVIHASAHDTETGTQAVSHEHADEAGGDEATHSEEAGSEGTQRLKSGDSRSHSCATCRCTTVHETVRLRRIQPTTRAFPLLGQPRNSAFRDRKTPLRGGKMDKSG